MNDEIAKMIAEEKANDIIDIIEEVDKSDEIETVKNIENEIIVVEPTLEIIEDIEEKTEKPIDLKDLTRDELDKIREVDPRFSLADIANTSDKRIEIIANNDEKTIEKRVSLKSKKAIKNDENDLKNAEYKSKIDDSMNKAALEKAYNLQQDEYYNNHKDVLQFARMKNSHSLSHMKFLYWFMISFYSIVQICYAVANIIKALVEILGSLVSLLNVFFESAFGKKAATGTFDKNGLPEYEVRKLNTFTRIFVGVFTIAFLVFVALAFLDFFTGINLIDLLKSYTQNLYN